MCTVQNDDQESDRYKSSITLGKSECDKKNFVVKFLNLDSKSRMQ